MKNVLRPAIELLQRQLERFGARFVSSGFLRCNDQIEVYSDFDFRLLNYVPVNVRYDDQTTMLCKTLQRGFRFLEDWPFWNRLGKSFAIDFIVLDPRLSESASQAQSKNLSVASVSTLD